MRTERLAEERLRRGDASNSGTYRTTRRMIVVWETVRPRSAIHGSEVAIVEPVGDVPADAELNDLRFNLRLR